MCGERLTAENIRMQSGGVKKLTLGDFTSKKKGELTFELAFFMYVNLNESGDGHTYQPQLPVLHDPELQPPPPIGLAEVIPKPERGPASIKSTLIDPHVVRRLFSTKNLSELFSYTLSVSFGSSRANPREGPAQPPCIRATRRAESILFCSIYSLSFCTAKSVTLKSDMLPPHLNALPAALNCYGLNFLVKKLLLFPDKIRWS